MVSLRLEAVGVRRGRRLVVSGVTTPPIPAGRLVAVIGPNAAGKSSLLRRIAGLLRGPGQVQIEGDAAGHRAIAYMPQDSSANAVLTVYESILLARKQGQGWVVEDDDLRLIDTLMAALNIGPLAFRDLGELSGGQRQLVAIAQALAREPRIMLLDEPTSALDLHRQIEVLDFMRDQARRQGRVVLIALHDLNQALRFADRLLVIAQGHMVAYGPPVEVLSAGLLREVWRVQARIEPCSRGCPQIIVDGTVR